MNGVIAPVFVIGNGIDIETFKTDKTNKKMKKIIGVTLLLASGLAHAHSNMTGIDLAYALNGYEKASSHLKHTPGHLKPGILSNSPQDAYDYGIYTGFIEGIVSVGNGHFFCLTNRFTVGEIFETVGKYLKANRAKWNQPADTLVIDALRKLGPCQK